jgi:uncharacterized membrane protein YkoI
MIEMRKVAMGAAVAALIAGGAVALAISSEEENETAIELSQVPQPARDEAQKQLGGTIREAKVMERDGQKLYELEGQNTSGQKMSVYVTADGKAVQVERDED